MQPHGISLPAGGTDAVLTENAGNPENPGSFPAGIITPGSESLVIMGTQGRIQTAVAAWGFPGKDGQLVINARAESAAQRPMFSSALETRRCLLPAECFYEWDSRKDKVTFSGLNAPVLYLAGLWSLYENVMRFVVLTTAANASMLPVHDRMPLMVSPGDISSWLFDTAFAREYLKAEMPLLMVSREYEQLSLI